MSETWLPSNWAHIQLVNTRLNALSTDRKWKYLGDCIKRTWTTIFLNTFKNYITLYQATGTTSVYTHTVSMKYEICLCWICCENSSLSCADGRCGGSHNRDRGSVCVSFNFHLSLKTEEINLYMCKGAHISMTACINIFSRLCVCLCVLWWGSAVIIAFWQEAPPGKWWQYSVLPEGENDGWRGDTITRLVGERQTEGTWRGDGDDEADEESLNQKGLRRVLPEKFVQTFLAHSSASLRKPCSCVRVCVCASVHACVCVWHTQPHIWFCKTNQCVKECGRACRADGDHLTAVCVFWKDSHDSEYHDAFTVPQGNVNMWLPKKEISLFHDRVTIGGESHKTTTSCPGKFDVCMCKCRKSPLNQIISFHSLFSVFVFSYNFISSGIVNPYIRLKDLA